MIIKEDPIVSEMKNSLNLINLDLAPLNRKCAHLPVSNSVLKANSKPELLEALEMIENPLLNN